MTIIRQESLFGIQDLLEMNASNRFEAIFSTINIDPIVHFISKKSIYGRPTELNVHAMIYSLIARIVDRIPTIKDLVKRLENDFIFRYDCGFCFSDATPSEASFSRLIEKLSQSSLIETVKETLVLQAIKEGFISDDSVSIDATHFESRDRAVQEEKKSKPGKKKRGRKSKAEKARYDQQKQAENENKSIYEKTIADQLDVSLEELEAEMPIQPKWGIKKNSEGKNTNWFGFKAHLAVGTSSQYILKSYLSSGSLNDGKAAIPLLKAIGKLPLQLNYSIFDAGYDYQAIYQQSLSQEIQPIIAYNKKNEGEYVGFDQNFAPTCVLEHSYRYDSFDPKYKTLKYKRPKECESCSLAQDSLCQKVYKIRQETDIRKYAAPGRGTQKWKSLFKLRTSVERVNAYLKEFFQLNNVRHRTGAKAKLHLSLATLVFNCTKLAVDRINQALKLNQLKVA
ncbi:transposase [Bacillus sp. AFS041924]|uniref:transposase n=1 Tax=Bacillus sp. AFS041924 TaxID=2033503 RepID=UPI000BFC4630|nr:transposase [Bacillus sp. AFS041924]PGS45881.1 IS5/IS1182 family transposase [Bacillus sp. AFS041924]